jgi:hypothetical protein
MKNKSTTKEVISLILFSFAFIEMKSMKEEQLLKNHQLQIITSKQKRGKSYPKQKKKRRTHNALKINTTMNFFVLKTYSKK